MKPSDQAELQRLDAISRERALTSEETDELERIINRGHKSRGLRVKWNQALDRKLLRIPHRKGNLKKFAEKHGMSPKAVYDRLSKLRAKRLREAKLRVPDYRRKR